MGSTKLGLPLEYQKMPEYFDATNVSEETDAKNSVIEEILKAHKVETVLDMTCGTGSQVFFLAERGYKVTGSDFSPALLEIARAKALKKSIDVTFIDGDMRTIKVGTFDAAITIFNAIGHLTKAGFEKAMRNIRGNLMEGGLYIFDILNLEAMTDTAVVDLAWYVHKKVNDTQMHASQCSTIDRESGRLTSYDSYMIQKNVDKPERFNHEFTLQIYTSKELRDMLSTHGFDTVGQYDLDGSDFASDKTMNILTVAKKR
jgi:2-polyprenyl-3-methyl-5-hydroxy-6-metoxy-1,4-benzoquinol methylase